MITPPDIDEAGIVVVESTMTPERSARGEPIPYSGDPVDPGGGQNGGHNVNGPGTMSRPRAPVVFMSPRLQAYVAASLFTDEATLEALACTPEVPEAERPAFFFFNRGRTDLGMLLWTWACDQGTFVLPRSVGIPPASKGP